MLIASIEAFHVPPRWTFVRIECDNGLVGWGEVGIQAQRRAVASAVETLSDLLVGRDPRRHLALWQEMWARGFFRGGAVLGAAVAGLDIALWDLRARAAGVPIHDLLGGLVRDRLPGYVWLGNIANDDSPELLDAEARGRAREGIVAFKLTVPSFPPTGYSGTVDHVVSQMRAVRDVVGPDGDVALDCHGRTDIRQASALVQALGPVRPLFVEEPVLPGLLDALARVCSLSPVPIAAGERASDRVESWQLLQAGVQVLQPDVAQVGGITELARICTVASLTGARVAPHCAIGPLALAASVQSGLALTEIAIQEDPAMPDERHLFDGYLSDSSLVTLINGHFVPNGQPGLGVEVDEDAVRTASSIPSPYIPPLWRHGDGSYAEW